MALALQAHLLVEAGETAVAEAFVASRIDSRGTHGFGSLSSEADVAALIERADPLIETYRPGRSE